MEYCPLVDCSVGGRINTGIGALNADNRVLESIIHCEILARCKAGEDLTCSKVVSVQDVPLSEHQVPEPWTGHLDRARLVFISSNPSIDPREAYPSWETISPDPFDTSPTGSTEGTGRSVTASTVRCRRADGPARSVFGQR